MNDKMYVLDCWRETPGIDEKKNHRLTIVEIPARFDFIGGWTDTPPYYFDNEACVLNSTLHLHSRRGVPQKAIRIIVASARDFVFSVNGRIIKNLSNNLIVKTVLDFAGLQKPRINLAISNSIPAGSGLGGSSLLSAAILTALWGYYKGIDYVDSNINQLINNVLYIEQLMKSGGGWQDQIGGILPGVKCIQTTPEDKCRYTVSYLNEGIDRLNECSLIIDTRIQRKASNILYSIRQKYINKDPRAIQMLMGITRNAKLGFGLLEKGEFVPFVEILSESWRLVNEVENGSVECCEALKSICRNDLVGIKIGGAGGGGFVLAIFKDQDVRSHYEAQISDNLANCIIYRPIFGEDGMTAFGEGNKLRIEHLSKTIDVAASEYMGIEREQVYAH